MQTILKEEFFQEKYGGKS